MNQMKKKAEQWFTRLGMCMKLRYLHLSESHQRNDDFPLNCANKIEYLNGTKYVTNIPPSHIFTLKCSPYGRSMNFHLQLQTRVNVGDKILRIVLPLFYYNWFSKNLNVQNAKM